MGDAFRGLTIRLGADARPLNSAINSITRAASGAQKQLNAMNKALKFDNTNVAAMQSRLELVEDKALLTARAANKIEVAMRQASQETLQFSARSGLGVKNLKEMAAETKAVHAANEKLHADFNHVNTDLAHIYEAAARVRAEAKGISFEKALKQVKSLASHMNRTTAAGKAAKDAVYSLVRSAAMRTDIGEKFGLQKTIGHASKLLGVFLELRRASRDFSSDIELMNKVEGFRAAQTRLISFKADLMQAASEAARFKSELYALGTNGGLVSALNEIKLIDAAVAKSTAHAREMAEAYALAPRHLGAAKERLNSYVAAQMALNNQLTSIKSALRRIESDPAFDKQAANSAHAYTNAVKVESAYTKVKSKITLATAALQRLEEEQRELSLVQTKTDKQSARYEQLTSHINKVNSAINRLKSELASLDQKHAAASLVIEFKELTAAQAKCVAETERLKQALSSANRVFGNLRTMGYGLYSTITPAILMAGRYAIQSADEVDAAYRDMRKTVNGTEEEFEHLRDAALAFGRTHVTSADTILEIEAIGGQLSIQAKNLEAFSRVVSNLDIATNLDTETISQNIGQLSNIMRDMNQDLASGPGSMEAFSDSLVRLGNNSAAQEDKIMSVMMRIASMGTISNMTTPDLLALATATAATGQGAEAAGTALSRTFSNIEAAVGKGGAKLEKFAEISGMSASEFADAWNTRPMEAFTAFINGLKRVDEEGGSVANTLSELSINSVRQRQTLMGLTTTTDVLTKSLIMSNDAWNGVGDTWGDAGDAAREAQRKAEGFSGQLQIMKNAAQELGVQLLDGAVPMLKELGGALQFVAGLLAAAPSGVTQLITRFAVLAAAAGPVLVAVGAIGDGITKLSEAVKAAKAFWLLKDAARSSLAEINTAIAKNNAAIEQNIIAQERKVAAIENVNKAELENYNVTTESTAVKERYIAGLNQETEALKAQQIQLEINRDKLLAQKEATVAAANNAKKLGTAVKAIGSVAIFMVMTELITKSVEGIGETVERIKQLENATHGLKVAALDFTEAANSQATAIKTVGLATEDLQSITEDAIKGNNSLIDSISSNKESASANSALVQEYANTILELSGQCKGSAESLALLRAAIKSYNSLTGESVAITDEFTGAINVNEDSIRKHAEAFKKQAWADAVKKNAESATQELAALDTKIDALYKRRDTMKAQNYDLDEINATIKNLESMRDSAQAVYEQSWSDYKKLVTDGANEIKKAGEGTSAVSDTISDVTDELDGANDELEELSDTIDSLSEKYPEFGEKFAQWGLGVEAFSNLLADLGLSMEDVVQGVEEMADKVSDGFNRIEENSEISLEKYMENLQHNKEVTAAWGDNLKRLYDKSSDETYRAWVNEMAEAGPEYAALIAEMADQDAATLEEEARAWQEAKSTGVDAYLASIGLTSEEANTKVKLMVSGIADALGGLEAVEAKVVVTDDGTVQVLLDKLTEVDRKNLATKRLLVTDDGTIIDMQDKCKSLNVYEINGKHFYVTDDGTIYDEKGKADQLNDVVNRLSKTVTTYFKGDTSNLDDAVSRANDLISRVSGGITAIFRRSATGNIFPNQAIRAIPRHADGGINGIVTHPTLTNIGWVGENGTEALLHMKNAGGAVIPLSNRTYVRPFARAVAMEMGGTQSPNVTYNVTVNGAPTDSPEQFARRFTRAVAMQQRTRA